MYIHIQYRQTKVSENYLDKIVLSNKKFKPQ